MAASKTHNSAIFAVADAYRQQRDTYDALDSALSNATVAHDVRREAWGAVIATAGVLMEMVPTTNGERLFQTALAGCWFETIAEADDGSTRAKPLVRGMATFLKNAVNWLEDIADADGVPIEMHPLLDDMIRDTRLLGRASA